jgi:hypothetical protein
MLSFRLLCRLLYYGKRRRPAPPNLSRIEGMSQVVALPSMVDSQLSIRKCCRVHFAHRGPAQELSLPKVESGGSCRPRSSEPCAHLFERACHSYPPWRARRYIPSRNHNRLVLDCSRIMQSFCDWRLWRVQSM